MRIIAAFSRRFEPDWLVDELCLNLAWCDDFAIYDDRGRDPDDLDWNEPHRYKWLHNRAGELGADYVIMTAPDERWANNTEQILKNHIEVYDNPKMYYRVEVLELYEPDAYRIDGNWENLPQCKIYPWEPNPQWTDYPLHNLGTPIHDEETRELGVPIKQYHLKHIERSNAKRRIKTFEMFDPDGLLSIYQQGYSYLDDETGIQLQKISPEEDYFPPYSQPYIFDPFGETSA